MMSARVTSALALVSFSLCFAQESLKADPNQSSKDLQEVVQEEMMPKEAPLQQSIPAEPTAQVSMNTHWAEHVSLENCRYGVVTSKRVRMRTAAQLDAPVIRELDKGTPLKITADAGDFYAVIPPFPLKAYVFRTYVLDGKIEGERVNIRLGPSPEAAILTQLSSGAIINGKPSTTNAKWLEIDLPATTRFYISKDYVQILDEAQFQQMAKSFINVQESPKSTVKEEAAISDQTSSTKEQLCETAAPIAVKNVKVAKAEIAKTERVVLNAWQTKEENLKSQWLLLNAPSTDKDYQDYLSTLSKKLKGTLEEYMAPDNAPGNYILKEGPRVIAIIYSAKLDLASYVGQIIEVKAVERDNNNYAYPAFCVLEVQ